MGRTFENRKHAMAKTQGAKIKVYSKFGKEIYVCAKNGGFDPDGNLALRSLIEKAKKAQVPTHVIDKAIDKAKGGGGEDFQPARYEGYGPGGSQLIVDCLTDNINRTFPDVRKCFTKADSKIGAPGCAAHSFDHIALFIFKGDDEEAVLEALMEADVDVTDVVAEGEMLTVSAPPTEYFKTKTALQASFGEDLNFEVDEITFEPQATVELNVEDSAAFEKFLDALNDLEDVQEIYHNAELAK